MSGLETTGQRVCRLDGIHYSGKKPGHDETETGEDGDRGEKEERGGERPEDNAESTEDGNGKPGNSHRSRSTVTTPDNRPSSHSTCSQ